MKGVIWGPCFCDLKSSNCFFVIFYRHAAKKKLLKSAQKVGLRSKQGTRKTKYVLPTPPMARRSMSPRSSDSESEGGRPGSEIFDDLSGKTASSIEP